ncbi:MAG: hypothetical protein GY810_03905 [Aureispira sp.]|nr:hypothetical protein [Aureispira sp.]
MFSLFGPPKKIPVHVIKKGKYLDLAKEASAQRFFKMRMKNRIRKALVGAWYILHETNDYVYWGRPIFKRAFSDTRIIPHEEFYKTSIQELREQFPQYKKLDGPKLKTTILTFLAHHIRQELAPEIPHTYISRWKATLQDKTFSIRAEANIRIAKQQPKEKNYHLALDKNSLELLHIDEVSENDMPWIEFNQ